MIYIISDTHFGHGNIIKSCGRPFENTEEMDRILIENWNNTVKPNDEVYHLGDVSFGRPEIAQEILYQLNGRIYLIKGNHEKTVLRTEKCRKRFEWVKDYYELKHQDKLFVMFHYPILSWNKGHYGSYHLYGHTHNNIKLKGRAMDVGVDNPVMNFSPMSIDNTVIYLDQKFESEKVNLIN